MTDIEILLAATDNMFDLMEKKTEAIKNGGVEGESVSVTIGYVAGVFACIGIFQQAIKDALEKADGGNGEG